MPKNSALPKNGFPSDGHLPETVDQLIALFSESLPDVAFPDASLAHLTALRSDLDGARERLDAARLALDEATAEYQVTRANLLDTAKRGHAYAGIFASDQPEVLKRLSQIELTPKTRSSTRPRKKASRKQPASAATSLPFEGKNPELAIVTG